MNRVQEIRKERSITQDSLANRVGISRKYLSNVERQLAVPSVEVALKISNALSVDIDKVFFDVTPKKKQSCPKSVKYVADTVWDQIPH